MTEQSFLPPLLAEIAEVAGDRAALLLLSEYGGQRVYFPLRAADNHWLVRLVGREAADAICNLFATRIDAEREKSRHGAGVVIPVADAGARGRAKRLAMKMLADGKSVNEVVKAAGVCQRTGWNYKARVKDVENRKQGRLF